ncbi:MAG: P-II family nitrogen regulator [Myxococcota bacterium]|nr:P-II family nitrogen regulator [Myxococcota bacterium]
MDLLVVVINQEEKLDEILSGFLELGVTGATILESQGMIGRLPEDGAVVSGLQSLIAGSRPKSSTVFSIIETKEKLDAAVKMIQDKCGDLSKPGSGVLFTIPVDRAVGLATAVSEQSK